MGLLVDDPDDLTEGGVTMNNMLEPRNLGGILGETFGIYGRNFLRLIAIVAIVGVILGILGYVLTLSDIALGVTVESLALFTLIMIILLVCSIVVCSLMEGALIHAVSEQSLGHTISIGRAYSFAWRRLGAMLGATILAGLACGLMAITIIGIPFAIYFGIRWVFICQTVLLEDVSPRDALSRSSDLVKDNWWRVFGIVLVVGIIVWVIGWVVGYIPVVGSTLGIILSTPIAITGATLLYYDLRVRKEGYNLETMARELGMADELSQKGMGPIIE